MHNQVNVALMPSMRAESYKPIFMLPIIFPFCLLSLVSFLTDLNDFYSLFFPRMPNIPNGIFVST